MENYDLLKFLQAKLYLYGIAADLLGSDIVLDGSYQTIVNDVPITNIGRLDHIFKWFNVNVRAGLEYDNATQTPVNMWIMLQYSWEHTQGGSNGYTIRDEYKIDLNNF